MENTEIQTGTNYKKPTWYIISVLVLAVVIVSFVSRTLHASNEPLGTLERANASQKAANELTRQANEAAYMAKWLKIKASADAVTTLKMTDKQRANSEANVIAIACQQGF